MPELDGGPPDQHSSTIARHAVLFRARQRRAPTPATRPSPGTVIDCDPDMSITFHRRSVRRPSHDYAGPGAWLITVKTCQGLHSLGVVRDGKMFLNEVGCLIHSLWLTVPDHHPNVAPDRFVVMPNHLHAILRLTYSDGRIDCQVDRRERFGKPVPGSVCTIVRSFKAETTRQVRALLAEPVQLWQPRFDDRCLPDAAALRTARAYIDDNPARWRIQPPHRREYAYRIVEVGDGCELTVPYVVGTADDPDLDLPEVPTPDATNNRFP
jgi:putative transposase